MFRIFRFFVTILVLVIPGIIFGPLFALFSIIGAIMISKNAGEVWKYFKGTYKGLLGSFFEYYDDPYNQYDAFTAPIGGRRDR